MWKCKELIDTEVNYMLYLWFCGECDLLIMRASACCEITAHVLL